MEYRNCVTSNLSCYIFLFVHENVNCCQHIVRIETKVSKTVLFATINNISLTYCNTKLYQIDGTVIRAKRYSGAVLFKLEYSFRRCILEYLVA